MKIQVLPSQIYNKISAGEVVEKPASVVKELFENSIDGGADKIFIEIKNGGISEIVVRDNGCGISPEDIEKAFLPHATSKIKNEEDLAAITSLGFRGEALASIASVSKVEMISKIEDLDYGIVLKISGGEIVDKKQIGAETGTTVKINDLFFNTPARLKFLKKPKSEEREITHLVSKLILANPHLSIRYSVDDKIIYNSFGNGLAEALYIVYGKETYDNLLEVNFSEGDISIQGFIARPTHSKPNRSYQTLFVNNRLITNYLVSAAVQDALDGFIMKGKFPLFALNLSVPYDSVDVNVHPSKQEVKFENTSKIYGIVNNAIYKTVSSAKFIQSEKVFKDNKQEEVKLEKLQKVDKDEGSSFSFLLKSFTDKKSNDNLVLRDGSSSSLSKIIAEKLKKESQEGQEKLVLEEVEIKKEDTSENILQKEKSYTQDALDIFDNFKIVGVVFNTYIIIKKNDVMFIIDQHAAHERQLYDRIVKEAEGNSITTQTMLVPYVLHLNNKEKEFILENIESLKSFGFDISEFGENTFRISEVPYILQNINIKEFFDSILQDINSLLRKPISLISDVFAKKACKAAVKAGDILSENEISLLLKGFAENQNVLLCPHGRPIILQFTKYDIEKWFKRVV